MQRLLILSCLILIVFGIANAQSGSATVISTRANLRDTPSQNGEVKQEVPVGTKIKVLDNKGAWYVVRIDDAVGWMHGNTIRFASDPSEAATQPSQTYTPPETPNRPARVITESSAGSGPPSGGRTYTRGPRGGCYYISGSGRKVYVDRSLCN